MDAFSALLSRWTPKIAWSSLFINYQITFVLTFAMIAIYVPADSQTVQSRPFRPPHMQL